MDGPDLKQQYLSELRGAPAAVAPRQPITLEELMAEQGRAAAAAAASPAACLDEAQRARTETRRPPILFDLLALCAQGLAGAGAFGKKIGATPELCRHAAAQEVEVGKVIKASGDLYTLASAAAAETAERAETLGEGALEAAHRFASDTSRDRAERSAVELSFAEPFRLYEEAEGRTARLEQRRERRLRPLVEARDEARGEAEDLRLIDRFVSKQRPGRGDA